MTTRLYLIAALPVALAHATPTQARRVHAYYIAGIKPVSYTHLEKGSGLGLSIVHQLVEKMGGSITVESVPGKGTEFMLFFPLEI